MGCGSSSKVDGPNAFKGSKNVAIIGGGIAGLSAAYYISQQGVNVTVFEKNERLSMETSYGPAALTMWKNVKKAMDKDGTVSLGSGGFLGALKFIKSSAEALAWSAFSNKEYERSGIMGQAQQNFKDFCSKNKEGKDLIDQEGLIYLLDEEHYKKNMENFKDDKSMVFYEKEAFQKSDLYDPFFDNVDYYGILWSKEEGYVDPQRIIEYLAKKVEEKGGKVLLNSTVTKYQEKDNQVNISVNNGINQTFDSCIVALGAFSGEFLEKQGVSDHIDEIFGIKGYSVTGRMEKGSLRRGVVDAQDTKFFRPFTDKNGEFCIRAGGCADSYDSSDPLKIDWDRMEEFNNNQLVKKIFDNNSYPDKNSKAVDSNYDAVIEPGKIEVWSGVRPVNKDNRLPLVRQVKGTKKTMVISGFGSNGFVMSWYAGPKAAQFYA